ncbi:TonB-dependent receptor plug domain-containing protein [Flavobacterium sp. GA093]|uniref:TonB-dependent receptor plug domain-containing protein n=1 Tax=Flavobacterium hydrocarbonoxydans TaxID=2683249 RepID=A0A6I4NSL8_9FLAO|nr:TonB-dependent receptor [Flavobacterium hydrocarbonoxydans]MWB96022.1 TonB-dependent receptor plug domain-containing protein [Flavobacterium hydrocarbonoxydans]
MNTKLLFTAVFLFLSSIIFAQNTISGKVVDEKGKPVPGANIYIDGTYDGATSSETGEFSFETTATGNQYLVVSFLIYETFKKEIEVNNFKNQIVKLKESVNALDAVVITAGTLESGDKARVSVLKPLDIVTTAGSAGNIIAALQTLPGTQTVGEDGRLFVRGGEASETQTFVDGIRVAQPYGATTNNVPTRGRFSPFLFSGIAFSTGGYSAEYGEALSSVLLLNTQDEADYNKTDMGLMSVGLLFGNTQKWAKSSLSVNTAYINLAPYQAVIPQNVEWNNPYQSLSGETVYRYHFTNGIFKLYASFNSEKFDLNQKNINFEEPIRTDLNNNNFYLNTSYKGSIGTGWQLTTGLSYGYSKNKIKFNLSDLDNDENAAQLKLKLRKNVSEHFKLSFGADYFITKFNENFDDNDAISATNGYDSNIAAFYTEGDILFSKNLAAKVGFRLSNNSLLDETTITPRASIAYKVSKTSQFSFAYGDFTQTPVVDYIKYSKYHQFESEKASHYILNYQFTRHGQTFRAEAYYKDYSNLVKYDTRDIQYNSVFNNNGSGYAKGLDLFWRDSNLYKNLEYWISYSYIDSERDYKNFRTTATPNFIANHSLSIVTKYFITDWKSQIGFTNSFSTGRPYDNPNETQFMNGKTKAYNSLSFNWAYLLTTQKILYFSVSNLLGTQNIFGYDYARTPDAAGVYNRQAVLPTADRFFFVGFFWTISQNKNDNQLKNL